MIAMSRILNPLSPIPLYRQLADILAEGIRSGNFPAETRIPSEHALAEEYGIGRPTVRQATEHLIRKGLLTRKRGAGTYVLAPAADVDLFSLGGTLSAFQKEGIHIESRIFGPIRKIPVPEHRGNPFSGQSAYFISRISSVAETPVLLEEMFLSPALFPGIDTMDLKGKSISRIVDETYYLQPSSGKQTFCVGCPGPDQAQKLGIASGIQLLIVKRSLHFPGAENGIYTEMYCLTDRFVFSQKIER